MNISCFFNYRLSLVVLIVLVIASQLDCTIFYSSKSAAKDGNEHQAIVPKEYIPSFAICITGQMGRLELGSKINKLFLPNLKMGFSIEVFVLIDDDVNNTRHSSHNKLKGGRIFNGISSSELKSIILHSTNDQIKKDASIDHIKIDHIISLFQVRVLYKRRRQKYVS